MQLMEGYLSNCDTFGQNIEERISLLQKLGISDLVFLDLSSLKSFSQQTRNLSFASGRFQVHVILFPNIELIDMAWSIINAYDSFSIFLRCTKSLEEDEFKDALYHAFSLTDDVGCAIDLKSALKMPAIGQKVQSLGKEFELNQFMFLDTEGLMIPNEVSKSFKTLQSKQLKNSKFFYFPNNQHGLGLINAFVSMNLALTGLVGTASGKAQNYIGAVDFYELYLLYRNKKEDVFSKRLRRLIDHAFRFFEIGEEAKSIWQPKSYLV